MSKGTNVWTGSGNVASDIQYGKTGKKDEDACNFRIAIEKAHRPLVFVRINIYGGNVDVCKMRGLKKGDYVIVSGELMNRDGRDGTITEVRCMDLVIKSSDKRRDVDGF